MNALRPLPRGVALACAVLLGACAQMPPREELPQPKPAQSYASAQLFAAPAASWPVERWWTVYGDTQLERLVDEALADSPSVAAAQARLARAQAQAQVTRANGLPQVSANASITEQRQSENYLSPPSVTPQGMHDYGRATLDFAWDLDLWGRTRASLAAATSEADATAADLAQARLILSTSVASSYADLARAFAALDTAQAALDVRSKTADLFQQRYANGLETLASVRQVDARRASAQADLLSVQEQIALLRNRIAALLGAGPDRGLAIERPGVRLDRPYSLPPQLAADLLGRRPDIGAARLRAQAAAQRIDAARAAFYPNVNLLAFVGVQSLGLDVLGKRGSTVASVGPAISLPIFDGGRLRGQLRGANAEYAEAVANYDRTLQQALQEVADAAISQRALGGQLDSVTQAVEASREAWRIQNNRYSGGLSTYLDVLNAEDTLLANLRAQSDLQSRAFALDVALVRALGGGYGASAS